MSEGTAGEPQSEDRDAGGRGGGGGPEGEPWAQAGQAQGRTHRPGISEGMGHDGEGPQCVVQARSQDEVGTDLTRAAPLVSHPDPVTQGLLSSWGPGSSSWPPKQSWCSGWGEGNVGSEPSQHWAQLCQVQKVGSQAGLWNLPGKAGGRSGSEVEAGQGAPGCTESLSQMGAAPEGGSASWSLGFTLHQPGEGGWVAAPPSGPA